MVRTFQISPKNNNGIRYTAIGKAAGGNKHGIMIPELLLGEELLRLINIRVENTKDF